MPPMPSRDEILQAPAPRVRYLELLSRAVEHIDAHLAEPLTRGELLAANPDSVLDVALQGATTRRRRWPRPCAAS